MNKLKIFICFLLLGILFFSLYYANDYYRAETYAKEIYENNDESLFFEGENTDIGFIIYPGGKVDEIAYTPLAKNLNEEGYTVSIVKFPIKLGIISPNKAEKVIEDNPTIKKWVIVGHSLGGTCASIYVANNETKISGIAFLGSYTNEDLSNNATLKTISITGTNDKIVNRENFENAKPLYNENHIYFDIEGGNHAYFGNYGEQEGDGTATITVMEQINLTVKYILENFTEPITD